MQDATRAQLCLTRLCELTAPQLLLQLWPVVLRIGRLVQHFRTQPVSRAAAFHFESELQRLLIEVGRRIVQWTYNHLESADRSRLPPDLFWHNDHYRLKRLSPSRNWNCLFGKIRVWRWMYESTENLGLSVLFPLELHLGVVAGVATPALADRVAQLAVEFSQRQVLSVLREAHHVCWGVPTLRKVTRAMADAMSPFRHQTQVEQVLTWLQQASDEGGPRRIVLSAGRDGVMLPIRGLQKYKEAAAATLSVFNRSGKRLGTVYLGQMPEPGQVALSYEQTALIRDVLSAWTGSPPDVSRTQGNLQGTGKLALVRAMSHHSCFEFRSLLSRDAMIEVITTEWKSLRSVCESLDDPRTPINIFHSVENIVAISLAAIIAGAEGPKSIARRAKNKQDWLGTWLDLPNGKTPSRDCIRTFFARVDPTAFQAWFFAWLDGLTGDSKQSNGLRIVAIDGKSLRHSFDTSKELRPLHLVSAWVAECHISLGQVATEEKSNEITAIPELLDQIDIEDAIVTIDAMGCQKDIAKKITSQKGKFVIAVKGNQPTLYHTIESFFEDHWADGDWSKGRCHRHHTSEMTGSRQDDRYYYVAPGPRREKVFGDWPSVKAIGMVISVRQEGDEVTEEVRYYILSEDLTGKDFARAVRQHWSIKNNCHWQLDVLFHEDASRVRERTLTNNLSWMRRVAISLLKHHPSTDSLKGKRQNAGWNDQFLAEVLQIQQ